MKRKTWVSKVTWSLSFSPPFKGGERERGHEGFSFHETADETVVLLAEMEGGE